MLRKINCIVCGAEESSMAYADDPWCGDICNVKVVNEIGQSQRDLSAPLFYILTDRCLVAFTNYSWQRLKEIVREYFGITGHFGPGGGLGPGEDVFGNGEKPADWTRRVLLYSNSPWSQQVSELRKPRTEVPDGILSGPQAVRGQAAQGA